MGKPTKITGAILIICICVLLGSCEKKQVPVLETSEISNITGTTATSGGTITDEGSGTVLSRGVCWSTGTSPTIDDNKTTDGAGAGTFISNLAELNGATKYFVKAYATNSVGTGYGMAMSFTTLGQFPTVTTLAATNINTTIATLNGTVNANYLSAVVTFEYGTSTSYGQSVTATQSPVTGNTITTVSASITGLTSGISYHYRIKAVNSLGTSYGNDMIFEVQCMYCKIVTYDNSILINEGTESLYCGEDLQVQLNKPPITIGNLVTKVQCTTNRTQVIDIDGNHYNILKIGTQTWMGENLRTTKYGNGDNIGTTVPATLDISTETNPKYQWAVGGDEVNVSIYGRLYTWYAATDSRGLCPTGWRLPSDTEWTTLVSFLGGESIAGGKMKTIGTISEGTGLWTSPNSGATNESKFSVVPAGLRGWDGVDVFASIGDWAHFLLPAAINSTHVYVRSVSYIGTGCSLVAVQKHNGCSIRCIKD